MDESKRIVEINGIKLEIDMRTAKRIEEFKIGDPVKVLVKKYSDYESHAGVIIGFDEFKALPTIIVAYLENNYNSAEIKFIYLNSQSKDVEICSANVKEIPFNKDRVIEMLNGKIHKAKLEVEGLERQKEFFLGQFGMYFKGVEVPV